MTDTAPTTISSTRLDDHATLVIAGDRHIVGRVKGRWIVTGAVVGEVEGVLLTHSGERLALGAPAESLHPGAEAAARVRLAGECCHEKVEIDAMVERLRQSCTARTG